MFKYRRPEQAGKIRRSPHKGFELLICGHRSHGTVPDLHHLRDKRRRFRLMTHSFHGGADLIGEQVRWVKKHLIDERGHPQDQKGLFYCARQLQSVLMD